jgi:hypothetical protein
MRLSRVSFTREINQINLLAITCLIEIPCCFFKFYYHGKEEIKVPIIETPFERVPVDLVGPIAPASEREHSFIIT